MISTTYLCPHCSTRSHGVMVPTDERALHEQWHTLWTMRSRAIAADNAADLETTWRALVGWVDANDLTGTQYDPRDRQVAQ